MGKVIYEMMTGNDRYDFPELDNPTPSIKHLNLVVLKACADRPIDRYRNGSELADDLERIIQRQVPLAAQTKSNQSLWAVGAGICVAIGGWILWGGEQAESGSTWREGIVAHWPLGEDAASAVQGVKDGVMHGAIPGMDRFGQEDGAMVFDGASYVEFGDQFDMGVDDLSVSFWFKTEKSRGFLFGKSVDMIASGRWMLDMNYVHDYRRPLLITAFSDESGTGLATAHVDPEGTALNDGRWHQLVAVFDRSAALRVFVDGEIHATTDLVAYKGLDVQSDYPLTLGVLGDGQPGVPSKNGLRWFAGSMDDVRIWRRALTDEEVVRHYVDESPGNSSVVEDDWSFEYSYSHVWEEEALRYLVETNNVRRFIEWQNPPMVYWGSVTNEVEGTIVYHFPFSKAVEKAHLRCSVYTWDFAGSDAGIGRGAGAFEVSTNQVHWVKLFNGLDPRPMWEADGFYNRLLPEELMGATNYFVRFRLLKEKATEDEYATAQHARMSRTQGNKAFEFRARFRE